jgi:hypothetical protein
MDYGGNDEDEDRDLNVLNDDFSNSDEVKLDLVAEEFGMQENFVQGVNLGENVIGSLEKLLFLDEISMFDIMDFLKLDKYLRRFMAQYNPEAINFPLVASILFLWGFFQIESNWKECNI